MLALQPSACNVTHPDVQLTQSKMFKVLEVYDPESPAHRSADSYKLDGQLTNNINKFLKSMRLHGLCTWSGLISGDNKASALKTLQPLVRKLISSYDEVDDEFCNIDQEEMCITRMPRIGRGKHNIHFDPLESPQHAALAKLASESHFSELLSKYMGAHCSLRESGISITRPYQPNRSAFAHDDQASGSERQPGQEQFVDAKAGEGMEWHSDGPKGEATILMALEDVAPEQGSLRVVPGSHKVYVDGIGHTEVSNVSFFFHTVINHINCSNFLHNLTHTDFSQGALRPACRGTDQLQLPRRSADDHRCTNTS